jgi:hypothetical protein
MPLQLTQVLGGPVSLVQEKPVLRVLGVRSDHQPIPKDLRDNRRGGDGQAQPIAFDDRPLFRRNSRQDDGVEKEIIGRRRQMPDRLTHGKAGGLENVQSIDQLRIHDADTDIHCHREKARVQTVALPLAQEFCIPQPLQATPAGQDHRRRHHRTGQRAASGLI